MPVYAEFIQDCQDQDLHDLSLLYPEDIAALLQKARQGKLQLVAGRFNGRLIAALTLTPIHSGDYEMARLTVRAITRRRGAARQLLIQTLKALPPEISSISANLASAPELSDLFAEIGFHSQGAIWRWHRPA